MASDLNSRTEHLELGTAVNVIYNFVRVETVFNIYIYCIYTLAVFSLGLNWG